MDELIDQLAAMVGVDQAVWARFKVWHVNFSDLGATEVMPPGLTLS